MILAIGYRVGLIGSQRQALWTVEVNHGTCPCDSLNLLRFDDTSVPLTHAKNGLYPVYRLEEDGSLLKEGGVTFSFSFSFPFPFQLWALRAHSGSITTRLCLHTLQEVFPGLHSHPIRVNSPTCQLVHSWSMISTAKVLHSSRSVALCCTLWHLSALPLFRCQLDRASSCQLNRASSWKVDRASSWKVDRGSLPTCTADSYTCPPKRATSLRNDESSSRMTEQKFWMSLLWEVSAGVIYLQRAAIPARKETVQVFTWIPPERIIYLYLIL